MIARFEKCTFVGVSYTQKHSLMYEHATYKAEFLTSLLKNGRNKMQLSERFSNRTSTNYIEGLHATW